MFLPELSYVAIPGGPGLASEFFIWLGLHGMKAEYIPSVQQDSISHASICQALILNGNISNLGGTPCKRFNMYRYVVRYKPSPNLTIVSASTR